MASQLCLVLGGVRSGKSAFAEGKVAGFSQSTLYVATGVAFDEEMKDRIQKHQELRPSAWATLEEPIKLAEKLSPLLEEPDGPGAVIIDSIDVWVANVLMEHETEDKETQGKIMINQADELLNLVASSRQDFVVVSSEVGLSLVSPDPLGRRFQDLLGTVNQRIAAAATEVFLVVAGIPTRIKPAGTE